MTITTYGDDELEMYVTQKSSIKKKKEKLWAFLIRHPDVCEEGVVLTKKDMLKLQKYINSQLK